MDDHAIDRRLLLQAAALSPALAVVAATHASAASSPDALVVVAELVSKPDHADALCDILVPFAEGAQLEPGCQHYTLLEDRQTPGRFLTYGGLGRPSCTRRLRADACDQGGGAQARRHPGQAVHAGHAEDAQHLLIR